MTRRKRTEKEELLDQAFQLIKISQLIGNKGIEFNDFGEDIPGYLHTNRLDQHWITNVNKSAIRDFEFYPKDLKKEGNKILMEKCHPKVLETNTREYKNWMETSPNAICETFQYLRKTNEQPYEWYLSVKRKLNGFESISLTTPIKKLSFASNALDKLFKRQPWLESKAPLYNLLSAREIEILRFVSDGFSAHQISEVLFISLHTVKTHRKRLWNKLEVNNIAELIRIADFYLPEISE